MEIFGESTGLLRLFGLAVLADTVCELWIQNGSEFGTVILLDRKPRLPSVKFLLWFKGENTGVVSL